jgi:hypothetical protein
VTIRRLNFIDETRYACPQIFPDHSAGGGPHPDDPFDNASDEFNCLILQLNIPLSILESLSAENRSEQKRLPVLIYIHGGGFVLGKIDSQHSTALMVQQSISDSQPVIGASIQYRLGALGYLQTSREDSNLALNDQRNALLWIQKFIAGFGGDSKRVTVFGESAGSISICYHMLRDPPSTGPLFQRAILMSGIIGPSLAPTSVQVAEKRYDDFLMQLGIKERGDEGLQKLREVDIDVLVKASAEMGEQGGMWLSVRDEEWFGEGAERVTWDRVPEVIGSCEWVNDIVLGCTGFEVSGRIRSSHETEDERGLTIPGNHLCEPLRRRHTLRLPLKHHPPAGLRRRSNRLQSIQHYSRHGSKPLPQHRPALGRRRHLRRAEPHASLPSISQDEQEHLPLHIQHPQPVPKQCAIPATAPLGRYILRLQGAPIPLPLFTSESHLNKTRTAVD